MDITTSRGPAVKAKACIIKYWNTLQQRYPTTFIQFLFAIVWFFGSASCMAFGLAAKPEDSYLAGTWAWLASHWNGLVDHFPTNFWRVLAWPLQIGLLLTLWLVDILACILWWVLEGALFACAAVIWFTFVWRAVSTFLIAYEGMRDWWAERSQLRDTSDEYLEVNQMPDSGAGTGPSRHDYNDDDATSKESIEQATTPRKSKDDSMV